jgi:hypothetical protein
MQHERERLSRQEIEAKCLAVYQRSLGLNHVTHVRIGPPATARTTWTWRVIEVGPDAPEMALKNAEEAIAKLQGMYDLAT